MKKEDMEFCRYVNELSEGNVHFIGDLIPKSSDEIFISTANGDNNYEQLGIHKGSLLIFDHQKKHVDGHPSCFINTETKRLKLLCSQTDGFRYMGKLVAVMNLV